MEFLVNDESNILFLDLKHQCLYGSFQLLVKSPRLLVEIPILKFGYMVLIFLNIFLYNFCLAIVLFPRLLLPGIFSLSILFNLKFIAPKIISITLQYDMIFRIYLSYIFIINMDIINTKEIV